RRKIYVPLIDRVLTYLSAGGVRRGFEAGETVVLPLTDWKPGETLSVHGPGAALTPTTTSVGRRAVVRLHAVPEPGLSRVERTNSGRNLTFVVNVGAGDSVLAPTDATALAAWFEPVPLEVIDPEAATARLAWSTTEITLWPWLVGLAGVLLIAEMFFVHWLCPRMNPALANVVVHRRGLLRTEK